MKYNNLAIYGGKPIRKKNWPYRDLFGKDEVKAVINVFRDSREKQKDFGYQGKYEKKYTDKFCELQGGGYADAVCSGTAGIYVALQALNCIKGSDVIVSPVTDPGGVMPVILLGANPVVSDSESGSFNMGVKEFEKVISENTRIVIVTHVGGTPANIPAIVKSAKARGIKVIEDCSQAHGAVCKGRKVGTFGDVAVFSTMFSKNHSTGGCGGIVYAKSKKLYWKIRAYADRGKPFNSSRYNSKDPGENLFPALNLNQDELSCAIGISTLVKLPKIIQARIAIVTKINKKLKELSSVVHPIKIPEFAKPSPFFHTLEVNVKKLKVSKRKFAEAVAAEGIPVNMDYKFVVSEWRWLKKYLKGGTTTPNASRFREKSFNLLFNERFTERDIADIVSAILKVESKVVK